MANIGGGAGGPSTGVYSNLPFKTEARRRQARTVSLICEDEPLSEVQIKNFQTRLQEYRTFLEAVTRLASAGNICTTEECVAIGENGLLTGEALNALQHAGAISVYNTLQQNNWSFPLPENSEVVMAKRSATAGDEFLDNTDGPVVRSDWPAVHVSECFIDGEKASLRGPARPLRTYLPPTLTFRNPADLDEELPETEVQATQKQQALEGLSDEEDSRGFELIATQEGVKVRKSKELDMVPLSLYYYGRSDGLGSYSEKKGNYRFLCCSCDGIMHNNVQFMFHILGHVDDASQQRLSSSDINQCTQCLRICNSPFDRYVHFDEEHRRMAVTNLLQQQQLAGLSFDATQTVLSGISWDCWICGQEYGTEMHLAEHLHAQHKNREMPYGCKLCGFRSSIYEDALEHFKKMHSDSSHVLCVYCLRVFPLADEVGHVEEATATSPDATHLTDCIPQSVSTYLNHLKLHQLTSQCRRCPACKLNFTNKNEYHIHRKLEHKASGANAGGPASAAAAGVVPGTVQTSAGAFGTPETEVVPTMVRPGMTPRDRAAQSQKLQGETENYAKNATDMSHLKVPVEIKNLTCLECGFLLDSKDHKQFLPCSECRFASSCNRSFQRHVKHAHGSSSATWRAASNVNAASDYRPFEKRVKLNLPCESESSTVPVVIGGHDLVDLDAEMPAVSKQTTDKVDESEEKRVNPQQLHCVTCGMSNMMGNRLADHLVEVCGATRAVCNPSPELLDKIKARQAEEAAAAEREKERTRQYAKLYADMPPSAQTSAPPPPQPAAQEAAVSVAGGESQQQCFQVQTESGEIQTFMLPEGFQLQEGQTLVLVEGEDGQPQLAVVNQELTEDQLIGQEGAMFHDPQSHGYMM